MISLLLVLVKSRSFGIFSRSTHDSKVKQKSWGVVIKKIVVFEFLSKQTSKYNAITR